MERIPSAKSDDEMCHRPDLVMLNKTFENIGGNLFFSLVYFDGKMQRKGGGAVVLTKNVEEKQTRKKFQAVHCCGFYTQTLMRCQRKLISQKPCVARKFNKKRRSGNTRVEPTPA